MKIVENSSHNESKCKRLKEREEEEKRRRRRRSQNGRKEPTKMTEVFFFFSSSLLGFWVSLTGRIALETGTGDVAQECGRKGFPSNTDLWSLLKSSKCWKNENKKSQIKK